MTADREPSHLLVVDDDRRLRDLLGRYLAEQGYRVTTAADAAAARAQMRGFAFDLLVVDVMMPGESGRDFARTLRRDSAVPILLLTAMGEAEDRVAGLESGADDYLVKPFEPRELVLRIEAILRRARQAVRAAEAPVRLGACVFDPVRGELTRGGRHVALTAAEAALLGALARRPGAALGRETLAREGRLREPTRAVDVLVTRLRRKIEPDRGSPRYLRTVRGEGYMLVPD
jgi:two-component system phosphate regulon response regulator OmpR